MTEPAKVHLPCTVAPVATPLEDGRLLAGGTFDYGDESPVVREEVVDTIMGGLRAALPGIARRRGLAPVVLLQAAAP